MSERGMGGRLLAAGFAAGAVTIVVVAMVVAAAPGVGAQDGVGVYPLAVPLAVPSTTTTTTITTTTTTTIPPTTTTTTTPPEPLAVAPRARVATTTTTTSTSVVEPVVEPATPPVRHSTLAAAPKPEPEPESERSIFASLIPSPSDVDWDLGHVGANATIAFGLVLLLGLPAELFNVALKARHMSGAGRVWFPWLLAFETKVNRLPDPLLLVGFSAAAAIVYSQLVPGVGLDSKSLIFVAALTMALIVVTLVLEAVRIPYLRRRHQVGSHLRMFPRAFLIAVILVLLSRLTGFEPGFIFGVTCGLAVAGALRDEDEGRSIALACVGLLAMAVIAWIVWIPVADAAENADPSTSVILFDTFLATLWVTGLQVVLFGLLPFRFLYGEKVLHWSRTGWCALYGFAAFMFVQTLVHPSADSWGGFSEGTMILIAVTGVVMLIAATAYWLYVRNHTPHPAPVPPPEPPPEPVEALSVS
jgi:hypothetical protein